MNDYESEAFSELLAEQSQLERKFRKSRRRNRRTKLMREFPKYRYIEAVNHDEREEEYEID